ncbi:MAG TPA: hypothetical protein PKE12_03700 [Kiritimatiellia bacterium]|nr:hypothetical protein [Kiritimatiellia bacterium]
MIFNRRLLAALLYSLLRFADTTHAQPANEAAYLGDVEYIRNALGQERSFEAFGKAGIDPQGVFSFALMGKQYDVIALLIDYGFPPDKRAAEKAFNNRHMTVEAMRQFVRLKPGFVQTFGETALLTAARADNSQICELLLASGVQIPQAAVSALFLHRDLELIRLMISRGADPYVRERGISLVEQAIRIKSADLLKVLDKDNTHSDVLLQFDRDYRPKNGKQFLGTWKYSPPGGGFGTLVVSFYPDGTALVAGDVGGVACVWKDNDQSVTITPLSPEGVPDETQRFEARHTDDGIILTSARELEKNESWLAKKITSEDVQSDWRYPPFVRVERILLTTDSNLVIQVNRRHISVPLFRLIAAAQETRYGRSPVDGNLLKWDEFILGPIETPPVDATEVPYVDKHASAGYSVKWDKLGFDHKTTATLKDGNAFTVFPSETTERYHNAETGPYGESVLGYAILADKPFSHGKDWLMFFFMKSKRNNERPGTSLTL